MQNKVNKSKQNSRKKQVGANGRVMAKIDSRIHKQLKEYADSNGKKFGLFLDELLRSGMESKGIPSLQ